MNLTQPQMEWLFDIPREPYRDWCPMCNGKLVPVDERLCTDCKAEVHEAITNTWCQEE